MIRDEVAALAARFDRLADMLRAQGYAPGRGVAAELSRMFANTTLPLELFREWLVRSPEAQAAFLDVIDDYKAEQTRPNVEPVDLPIRPEEFVREPAQNSEPGAGGSPDGTRGTRADSIRVSLGNAASALGRAEFVTRPVKPSDIAPANIGLAQGFRGQRAIEDESGPVRANVKFRDGPRLVEFLDKRGHLILSRIVSGPDAGAVVSLCIEYVEPESRSRVLAALGELPGANDEFNFSPFDGTPDPWNPAELISHPTTVETVENSFAEP